MHDVRAHSAKEVGAEAVKNKPETLNWLPNDLDLIDPDFIESWNTGAQKSDRLYLNLLMSLSINEKDLLENLDIYNQTDVVTLATKLINSGREFIVAENLDKFPKDSVDATSLAYKLIDSDNVFYLNLNIDKFLKYGVDATAVADKLIDTNYAKVVANNLAKFPEGSVDTAALINKLIERDDEFVLADNLHKFSKDSVNATAMANKLIETGSARTVTDSLEKFLGHGLDAVALATKIINSGGAILVADALDKFPEGSVDATILARQLIETGNANFVASNFDKFLKHSFDAVQILPRLIDTCDAKDLAYHLNKFPKGSIDATAVASKLINESKANLVLDNFDKFIQHGVDTATLANTLMMQTNVNELPYQLHSFPKGSIDATALVNKLIRNFAIHAINDNIEQLLRHGYDATSLATRLIDSNCANAVADNLDKFPEGSVNTTALVNKLFELDRHDIVADNLEKFPNNSVDAIKLAYKLIEGGGGYVIINNLKKFLDRGVDATDIVAWCIDAGDVIAMASNLDSFPEHAITPEIRRQLPIQIKDALSQRRFRLVHTWLLNMSETNGSPSLKGMLDQSSANNELAILIRDKRLENAKYLYECMMMTDTNIDESLSESLQTESTYADVLPRKIDTETHVVADEVLEFYSESYFEQKINNIMSKADWSYKLDFKDRANLNSIMRGLEDNKKRLRDWIRQYMLHGVSSELKHQNVDHRSIFILDPNALMKESTREQILNFFDSASARFSFGNFGNAYGGSAWSDIAKAGYALWANDGNISVLLDYIFDLEHNTGAIFDKNKTRIKQNATDLKKVLDIKREGDLMTQLPELDGICDQNTIDSIQARMRIITKIERKVGITTGKSG